MADRVGAASPRFILGIAGNDAVGGDEIPVAPRERVDGTEAAVDGGKDDPKAEVGADGIE